MIRLFAMLVAATLTAATARAQTPSAPAPAAPAAPPPSGAEAPEYGQDKAWLCLPGRSDLCSTPLPTTALNANGYGSIGRSAPDPDARIDCFYVYPTVSRDPTDNSDLEAGPEELGATTVQFARFSQICRPFVPVYRQATLAALMRAAAGQDPTAAMDMAYGDVRAAWRQYLAHRNGGRPFVLIGHSQGTIHLTRLIAEELEGKPDADRMLSALLIGYQIEVPEGQAVGGTFRSTPLCTRTGQTGCIVTFVSFRAESPPGPGAMFGRTVRPGMTIGCTHPARLGGSGSASLDSYWYAGPPGAAGGEPIAWSSEGAPPTPFLRTEGLVQAACVNRPGLGYLSVSVQADPDDARTDRIPGDVRLLGQVQPGWGLHLADMNLALGDLMHLVEAQRDAFLRR